MFDRIWCAVADRLIPFQLAWRALWDAQWRDAACILVAMRESFLEDPVARRPSRYFVKLVFEDGNPFGPWVHGVRGEGEERWVAGSGGEEEVVP